MSIHFIFKASIKYLELNVSKLTQTKGKHKIKIFTQLNRHTSVSK